MPVVPQDGDILGSGKIKVDDWREYALSPYIQRFSYLRDKLKKASLRILDSIEIYTTRNAVFDAVNKAPPAR